MARCGYGRDDGAAPAGARETADGKLQGGPEGSASCTAHREGRSGAVSRDETLGLRAVLIEREDFAG